MKNYHEIFSPITIPKDIMCLDYRLDTTSIKDCLSDINDFAWMKNMYRQFTFPAHAQTQTLFILWQDFYENRFSVEPAIRHPVYYEKVIASLDECIKFLTNYYDGTVYRLIITKLKPKSIIPKHADRLECSLEYTHRVHIPIITNEKVIFSVSDKTINMKEGYLYEINNKTVHGVSNDSDLARIHIIIDIVEKKTMLENVKDN